MFGLMMSCLFALGAYQFYIGLGFLLMVPVVGLVRWSCYRELERSRRTLRSMGMPVDF